MSEKHVSRRRILSIFGNGAQSFGAAFIFSTSPLAAATARFPAWLFDPCDLSKEVLSLRSLLAERDHPDFRLGSMIGGYPPGKRSDWYIHEKSMREEALFGVPARCAEDVLRKYAMFEEMDWRSYRNSMARSSSSKSPHNKFFGHWYAQLESDAKKYSIDINPWWQDGTRSQAIIDGQHVEWIDGDWERYDPDRLVKNVLKKIKRKKYVFELA